MQEQATARLSSSSESAASAGAMAADEEETTLLCTPAPAHQPIIAIHRQHQQIDNKAADHKPKQSAAMSTAVFLKQIVAVCAADLSSFGVGLILGYSAIALPQLQHPDSWLPVTDDQASWIASLPALSLAVGCALAGCLMDRLGRRLTLQIQCIPSLMGWVLLAMASSVPTLYAGRLLTGFGGGMVDSTIQVYIGEITTPKLRGALASTPCLCFSLGLLTVYVMGAFHLAWNLVAALCAAVPLLALLALCFLPESPVWLQARGKHAQAQKALIWFGKSPQDCDDFRISHPPVQPSDGGPSALQSLLSRHTRRPLALLLAFFFFQQFCGMNAVVFYAVHMFQSSGGAGGEGAEGLMDEHQAAVVIGLTRVLIICLTCGLLTRLGRRPVSLVSGLGQAASMLTLGTIVYLKGTPPLAAALACLAAFIASNTLGFFAIPWIMLGELLPERCRGLASGLLSAVVYIFIFAVVKSYPGMLALFGQAVVFWLFGGVSLLGSAFVYFFLPETKGKTLLEIEQSFRKE